MYSAYATGLDTLGLPVVEGCTCVDYCEYQGAYRTGYRSGQQPGGPTASGNVQYPDLRAVLPPVGPLTL